jgi:16S rRNA (cytidine1402-2'-O)-methyltransferase
MPERTDAADVPVRAAGVLTLAATPIGAVDDASPRLVRALESAAVIAAEDTRRLRALGQRLGITVGGRIMSYFEANEVERTPELISTLQAGTDVLLVTDAGMPSVSDPGYRLVVAAVESGIVVRTIPGPSAVLAALAVSGLPVDRFAFEGFLPRKAAERARRLVELGGEPRTMVFFEAPHRTGATLSAMVDAFGPDRGGAVCRELTKVHEEVVRGPLSSLAAWADQEVRGEVTLVVAGAPADPEGDLTGALEAVRSRVAGGERLTAAVADVAAGHGVARNALYSAALRDRSRPADPSD